MVNYFKILLINLRKIKIKHVFTPNDPARPCAVGVRTVHSIFMIYDIDYLLIS